MSGIKPCDLSLNEKAMWAVKRRFRECLGNLIEVHDCIKRQEKVEPRYGPYYDFAVEKAKVTLDGEYERVIFSMTGCELEPDL